MDSRRPRRTPRSRTLSALPGKGCVLTVVLPAYVVPTEAERVDVTLGCVRERERIIGGMPGVLEAQLGGIGVQALGARGGHVDEIRRLDGPFRALAIEDDRRRFDAKELPDEARQGSHRAAGRAAGDSRHRVALLGGGARVRDEADRPVAFAHLLRRQTEDYEAEAVKRDGAVGPAFDLKRHCELAVAFCRSHGQLARDAEADEVAIAGFVVLAAHVPGRRRHVSHRVANYPGFRLATRMGAVIPQVNRVRPEFLRSLMLP